MAEYTNSSVQVVAPGESVIFTDAPVPCTRGLVRHRDGTGNFLLSGFVPNVVGCGCNRARSANYLVEFGANISIPADGTIEPISLAIAVDGAIIPSSRMIVTPTAIDEYFNIGRAINAEIWRNCCETVTVINTSTQPIQVSEANIIFSRPDLVVTQ